MASKTFNIAVVIKAVDKATSVMNGISESTSKFGKRLHGIGKGLTQNVSLPLAGIGALSFKASADFGDSMDRILTQTDASAEQIDAWRKQILKDAPKLGIAPNMFADALLAAVSAGEEGQQAYETAVSAAKGQAAQLGAAADLVSAATSVTENYGKANLSTADALSILLATVNYGKGDVAQLAPAMGPLAAMAKSLEVPFNDVGAAMAVFTLKGVEVSQSATRIEGIFRSIIKPAAQSQKLFKKLGYTYEGLQKSIKTKGLLATLEDLNGKVKGNQLALAQLFPDTEAFQGVQMLLADETGSVARVFDKVAKSGVSMEEVYGRIANGDGQKTRQLMSGLTTSSIRLGKALAPLIVPAFDAVSSALERAGAWFEKLDPSTQKMLAGFVAGAVILGPFIMLLSSLAVGAVAVGTALVAVGWPVIAVIAAIAALAALVAWFVVDWKGAAKALLKWSPFGMIVQAINAVSKALFGVDLLAAGRKMFTDLWDGFKAIWPDIERWIRNAIRIVFAAVPDFMKPDWMSVDQFQWSANDPRKGDAAAGARDLRPAGTGPLALSTRDQLRASVGAVRDNRALVPMAGADEAKAEVTVSFRDMPKGAQAYFGKKDPGVKLNLDTGYAMGY